MEPRFSAAYNTRGAIYYDTRIYDHAISDATKAIELDPTNAVAYASRGAAYLRKRADKESDF